MEVNNLDWRYRRDLTSAIRAWLIEYWKAGSEALLLNEWIETRYPDLWCEPTWKIFDRATVAAFGESADYVQGYHDEQEVIALHVLALLRRS